MRTFIKSLLFFSSFAFVFYVSSVLFSGLLIPQEFTPNINFRIGSYGHMYTRLKEVKENNHNIDILFLGSSHSYRGFDPRNFKGFKTLNLGSSAQTPIQTELLLDRYLDKLNPKKVIYEVYPGTFTMDGVESSLDIIANDKNDFLSLKMAISINHIKTYNTLIYATFRDLLHLNQNYVEPIKKDGDTYIKGGFVEKKMSTFKFTKQKSQKWVFEKKSLLSFNNIINKLKSRKINVILVYAPITKNLYDSYSNNESFDSIMSTYKIPYYNFNKILILNDSLDFYDSNHLNQAGVNTFNLKLKELILKKIK